MTTTDGLSTTPLDGNVLESIRQAIADFLQRCGAQHGGFMLDEAWYTECYHEAITRGIPMDGKYSIRSFMAVGVAITVNTYAHIPDRAARMWVCLLFALIFGIDDDLDGGQDMDHMNRFNERFVNCQPQGNPALEALDKLLREAPRYYSSFVSNLITTSALDYVSSIILDHKTKNMQISTQTPSYPEYWRTMSGLPSIFVLFIFPSTLPVEDYIQSMPDLAIITGYVNDVLSFYKEEIAGDTANYVSLRAASRGITKLDALHEVVDQTVHAHHNILESLKPHTEAYEAYVSFFHGYIRFHASPRYKLEELLSERSSCNDA